MLEEGDGDHIESTLVIAKSEDKDFGNYQVSIETVPIMPIIHGRISSVWPQITRARVSSLSSFRRKVNAFLLPDLCSLFYVCVVQVTCLSAAWWVPDCWASSSPSSSSWRPWSAAPGPRPATGTRWRPCQAWRKTRQNRQIFRWPLMAPFAVVKHFVLE